MSGTAERGVVTSSHQPSSALNDRYGILDVGCGDSRYTLDALHLHPGSIRFAGTDEDPSAIAFLRAMLPSTAIDPVGLLCTSLEYLTDLVPTPTLPEAGFDVVLSANLLDDLDDDAAILLLRHMSNLTRPGGVTAICSSTPDDKFRTIAEWVSDMPIHFRDQSMVLNLFPGINACSPKQPSHLIERPCAPGLSSEFRNRSAESPPPGSEPIQGGQMDRSLQFEYHRATSREPGALLRVQHEGAVPDGAADD